MSINSIVRITGSSSAGADSIATIDIPQSGFIIGIACILSSPGLPDNSIVTAELSFGSTNQITVNDSRAVIAQLSMGLATVTTSGTGKADSNLFINLPDGIPVAAGERIHLHTTATISATHQATFILYMDLKGTDKRSVRRG